MKNKLLIGFCALFGIMMVNAGLNKFFNYMPMPEMSSEQMAVMNALITTKWILPLVGFVEILGGILIAIPQTRALGAITIFPIMVGIVVHNAVHAPTTIAFALVFFAINIWAILDSKDKYLPMIK
ncbi:MAG: DoxX family protein [Pseudarcicella sp.]|nr:DoxX family protein [Pseudarcicella sp.]MBP6410495.1 DoxX family protein [Pseudarcicella sp.]